LASTAGYVLAFWNFRLTRHSAGSFHVSRGLLTTRATSIDVSRLRGVSISETFVMRLVGGARTLAVATGLDVRRNAPATRSGTVLLPDAPRAAAIHVAGEVLAAPDVVAARLSDHGPVARRRRFTRALGAAAVLVVVAELVLAAAGPFGWAELAALALLLPALPLAADRAQALGHVVRSGYLVVQAGSVVRRRVVLQTDAIIGWNLRQSFFQRRAGVATMVATTAAGRQSYRLLDLPLGEVRVVADEATPGLLADFTCPASSHGK
jgi:putative membrane protein